MPLSDPSGPGTAVWMKIAPASNGDDGVGRTGALDDGRVGTGCGPIGTGCGPIGTGCGPIGTAHTSRKTTTTASTTTATTNGSRPPPVGPPSRTSGSVIALSPMPISI